ncbi:MAG TPA: HAD family hydrolase [Mycobacterium sp.]|uniref:HAD family hydrolase n=1 Tax=Mycobacterium sp. TaxID=1785 RepID=UPI002F41029F
MPGARDLLERLTGRVPLAVATNSPRAMLNAALATSGLAGFFEVSVAADEVERPKPDPQLYLKAFDAWRTSARGRGARGFRHRSRRRPQGCQRESSCHGLKGRRTKCTPRQHLPDERNEFFGVATVAAVFR